MPRAHVASLRERWRDFLLVAIVVVPIAFNAVALWSEVAVPIPGINDTMFHHLMIRSASEAIASGANPLDSWGPEMDLGAPRFIHYQNLPALFVIGLDYLTFGLIDLATLLGLTRYALLLTLPLVVYWSMRRMEFSQVAAAGAASMSSLFSANGLYGIEYESYIWRGWGMYTQQWAVHLSFILMACLWRLGRTGRGVTAVVLVASALVVSHLLYAEMMVITGLVVFLFSAERGVLRARLAQFIVAALLIAVVTSFLWFTYLQQHAYVGESPYDAAWKLDSFGVGMILGWLFDGTLFDHGRLPVITILLALGLARVGVIRTRLAWFSLALFIVWLVLYFGRSVWGPVTDYIPSGSMLLFHRFIGSLHIASVLLIGLGFEALWRASSRLPRSGRPIALGVVCVALLTPPLLERGALYADNSRWMHETAEAYARNDDAHAVLATLAALPDGRVYAGLRANWGENMRIDQVPWYRLLVFEGFSVVSVPLPSINLNSDLMFHFDDQNPVSYELFDVRYVVAPTGLTFPDFLRPIMETPRYTLYRAPSSGSAMFARSIARQSAATKMDLFFANRSWLFGPDPAAGSFIRWEYPSDVTGTRQPEAPRCADGSILREELGRSRVAVVTDCGEAATLVLKHTYHPHWRVTIDGVQAPTFMVSPSFIGVDLPPGTHEVVAEYRSGPARNALLAAGFMTVVGLLITRRQVEMLR